MTDLTDQQKSVLLAKAMGWAVKLAQCGEPRWALEDVQRRQLGGSIYDEPSVYEDVDRTYSKLCPNLYDPANMHLAWRVLNWADAHFRWNHYEQWLMLDMFWENENIKGDADAQRLWLDKIFDLCVEAGIIKVNNGMD